MRDQLGDADAERVAARAVRLDQRRRLLTEARASDTRCPSGSSPRDPGHARPGRRSSARRPRCAVAGRSSAILRSARATCSRQTAPGRRLPAPRARPERGALRRAALSPTARPRRRPAARPARLVLVADRATRALHAPRGPRPTTIASATSDATRSTCTSAELASSGRSRPGSWFALLLVLERTVVPGLARDRALAARRRVVAVEYSTASSAVNG